LPDLLSDRHRKGYGDGSVTGSRKRRLSVPFAFVICTEPPIEKQSRLLVRSIRRFGGGLASAPIVSYAPRPGQSLSAECRAEFRRLDVMLPRATLNRQWTDYPLANKPLAAANAESHVDADALLFLDSDMVLLDEPTECVLGSASEIALRPAFHRNIAVSGSGETESAFWKSLYLIAGCRPTRRVRTTCDYKVILEYYNSGMIAVRRERGLFAAWRDALLGLFEKDLQPQDGPYYLEQAALAVTVTKHVRQPTILSPRYNLPVHWPCLQRGRVINHLESAVSLHYADSFSEGGWRKVLKVFGGRLGEERTGWLEENLTALDL